ncbi:MAG: TatD family hydrolase [Patescibacteria group bacterium]|nr:TatD family hydrolase [Patescibacteria group bacterium]
MFDTHCHLNFKAFKNRVKEVIEEAKKAGVNYFVVPGSDVETSKKAVEIAKNYSNVYAAVGIHPHHTYQYQESNSKNQKILKIKMEKDLKEIENLLINETKKVIAVGEIGIDRYYYRNSKYSKYVISPEFVALQKIAFFEQLKLAEKYQKAVIIHNRQAKKELLDVLLEAKRLKLKIKGMVFHCCEPDDDLLNFALKNKIFIGVDGDLCYSKRKQSFVKNIPLELLVLETDSPFLSPKKEFLPNGKQVPNEPKNLQLIVSQIAKIINKKEDEIKIITTKNAKKLFNLD